VLAEIAHRRGHADILLVKNPARRPGDMGALGDAAHRERHVGGNDDVVGGDAVGDPVVGGVEAGGDDHVAHHRIAGRPKAGIGDQRHPQAVALGDLEDLRLDRAGIGVDIDFDCSRHVRFGFTRPRQGWPDRTRIGQSGGRGKHGCRRGRLCCLADYCAVQFSGDAFCEPP
jgi:hypothetical protein